MHECIAFPLGENHAVVKFQAPYTASLCHVLGSGVWTLLINTPSQVQGVIYPSDG